MLRALLTLLLSALAVLAACDRGIDPAGDVGPLAQAKASAESPLRVIEPGWLGPDLPPVAQPATPDQAVASFLAAHDSRNWELLDLLMHPQYRFFDTVDEYYDRAADRSIMTKMMVGRTGDAGIAIDRMTAVMFLPVETWMPIIPLDAYFGEHAGLGGQKRVYNVLLEYEVAGQMLIMRVEGLVHVYVLPTDGTYQILGMIDDTLGSVQTGTRTESISWTQVKALFE